MELSLFDKYKVATELTSKAVRATERGELMKSMMEVLNVQRVGKFKPLTMPRMGLILQGIPTDALYVLKSKCTQEANRNPKKYHEVYSKVFWFEIRAR